MRDTESVTVSDELVCGEELICGCLTIEQCMADFFYFNVGDLNTGWHPYETEEGTVEYLYVNVDNVTSDTLDITRIHNNIIAREPYTHRLLLPPFTSGAGGILTRRQPGAQANRRETILLAFDVLGLYNTSSVCAYWWAQSS